MTGEQPWPLMEDYLKSYALNATCDELPMASSNLEQGTGAEKPSEDSKAADVEASDDLDGPFADGSPVVGPAPQSGEKEEPSTGVPDAASTKKIGKERARPTWNKKRYKPPRQHDASECPRKHNYCHEPPDSRCKTCMATRLRQQPAIRLPPEAAAESRAKERLAKVHTDYIGPTNCDIYSNNLLLTTRDEMSNYSRVAPSSGRKPETTWRHFSSMYPGTCLETPVRSAKLICCDGDGSFMGKFEIGALDRGSGFRKSIPDRSATNTGAEGYHDRIEKGTASGLMHGGGPNVLWSFAARVFVYNAVRNFDSRQDGKTPYERFYGREWKGTLIRDSHFLVRRTILKELVPRACTARKGPTTVEPTRVCWVCLGLLVCSRVLEATHESKFRTENSLIKRVLLTAVAFADQPSHGRSNRAHKGSSPLMHHLSR